MDKLEHIFELQKGFQDKIKRERNLDFTPDQWIQKQTLAMISELAELLDEVNFKWWKNPHDLYNVYVGKNKENHDRQDGKSQKHGYETGLNA